MGKAENETGKACKALVESRGGVLQRVFSGKLVTTRGKYRFAIQGADNGTADYMGCIYGMPLAVEIKTTSKRSKQEPDQVEFQRQWEAAGGLYVVVRSAVEMHSWLDNLGASDAK